MSLEYNQISGVATIFSFEVKPMGDTREVGIIRVKEDNSYVKDDGTRDQSKNMFIDLKFFQDTAKRRFDKTQNYLVKGERVSYVGTLKDNKWVSQDGVKHEVKFIEVSRLIPFSMLPKIQASPNGNGEAPNQENSAPANLADIPAAVGYDEEAWG